MQHINQTTKEPRRNLLNEDNWTIQSFARHDFDETFAEYAKAKRSRKASNIYKAVVYRMAQHESWATVMYDHDDGSSQIRDMFYKTWFKYVKARSQRRCSSDHLERALALWDLYQSSQFCFKMIEGLDIDDLRQLGSYFGELRGELDWYVRNPQKNVEAQPEIVDAYKGMSAAERVLIQLQDRAMQSLKHVQ